jgi:hypothetical protein
MPGSHGLMENRSGLLVDACLSEAAGSHAERVAPGRLG